MLKTKNWITLVHVSINYKVFGTGKLNKNLAPNPQKKVNSNDLKTPKCMSNLQLTNAL